MTDKPERRVGMVYLKGELKNISEKVDSMHTCLFGNGDYKNNLVTYVQKNTTSRKQQEFHRGRSWVFWVAIIAAVAGNMTALAVVLIK